MSAGRSRSGQKHEQNRPRAAAIEPRTLDRASQSGRSGNRHDAGELPGVEIARSCRTHDFAASTRSNFAFVQSDGLPNQGGRGPGAALLKDQAG